MLRREGDGVTWWIRREQLEGRTGEPHRSLVLTLATRGGADEQARLGSLLLELLEDGFQEAGASAVFRGAAVTRHDFSREPFGERHLLDGLLDVLATGEVFQSNWLWAVTGTGVAEEAKPGHVGLDLRGGRFGSDIWQWQIYTGTETGSDAFRDHLAVLWTDSLRVVGEHADLLWGGVYHDVYAMIEPPYERYHGILQGLQTADRHPRGYYWCNHLSAGQLDRLGGIGRGARVRPGPRGPGPAPAAVPLVRRTAAAGAEGAGNGVPTDPGGHHRALVRGRSADRARRRDRPAAGTRRGLSPAGRPARPTGPGRTPPRGVRPGPCRAVRPVRRCGGRRWRGWRRAATGRGPGRAARRRR